MSELEPQLFPVWYLRSSAVWFLLCGCRPKKPVEPLNIEPPPPMSVEEAMRLIDGRDALDGASSESMSRVTRRRSSSRK